VRRATDGSKFIVETYCAVVRLDRDDACQRLTRSRVARLATVTDDGAPHAVPICFVVDGDTVYSAVDDKPKTSTALKRLANVAANARASVLADRYDEDWSQLWWVRADGRARIVDAGSERERAIDQLRAKYPQYATHRLTDALLAVDVSSWTGWAASDTRRARGR